MNDFLIRRATANDIDFLIETVIEAEKSGTNSCGLANFYGISESKMRDILRKIFEENIPGFEFSISSFFIAQECATSRILGAVGGWLEKTLGGEAHS